MTIKCLSVRQPHAALIVRGLKDIENRSRVWSYRGPLLIHAPLRLDSHADTRGELTRAETADLPRGGIIGAVTLVDIVTKSRSRWFDGPVGWVLRDAIELPFRPYCGQLFPFDVELTAKEERAVRAMLAHDALPLFSR